MVDDGSGYQWISERNRRLRSWRSAEVQGPKRPFRGPAACGFGKAWAIALSKGKMGTMDFNNGLVGSKPTSELSNDIKCNCNINQLTLKCHSALFPSGFKEMPHDATEIKTNTLIPLHSVASGEALNLQRAHCFNSWAMLSLGFQGIEILFMNHPKISINGVSASSKREHQSVIPQAPWKRSPRSERASSETLKAESEDLDRARFIRSRYVAFPKSGRYSILGWVETVLHRPLTNHCWSPSSPESRGNSKMVSACFCWSMRLTATAESGQTHVLSWVQCVHCVQCVQCVQCQNPLYISVHCPAAACAHRNSMDVGKSSGSRWRDRPFLRTVTQANTSHN